jgi:transcriptional regulator of acetoin/glycerol metabolism
MLLSTENRLFRARTVLERKGAAPDDLLPASIAESWSRCLAAGLDPHNPPSLQTVGETILREARQRRDLLRRLALCEMDNLVPPDRRQQFHDRLRGRRRHVA